MPPSDRLQRLLKLVVLLQSGRANDSRELAELCGVSRRTIFRDLRVLQKSGIPISYRESDGGYRIPASAGLPSPDFSLEETLSMLLLCHSLGDSQQGIPYLRAARTAALKLLGSLPAHIRDYMGELTQTVDMKLDPATNLRSDDRWYDLVTQSLRERRKIRLQYRSLADGEAGVISTAISPYRMLFARRAWYVIGRSSLHREVRTFHLGRIVEASLLDETFQIPERFSLERYLGNAWFLIREPGPDREVVVRFQPRVAQNVAEVCWHKTQQCTRNPDGTLEFRATVSGLGEIVWWILGYGDQAEVISPPELRAEVLRHLRGQLARYADSPQVMDASSLPDSTDTTLR